MVGLARRASLSVAAMLSVVAAVVVAGLGIFFQLLCQVGSRRAGGNVVFVAILRDLQLLDETHRPERQPEANKRPGFVDTAPFGISDLRVQIYSTYFPKQR